MTPIAEKPGRWFPGCTERRQTSPGFYGTLTVTVAEVRPYWLVAYSVYVVVDVGLTVVLVPRTAPKPGVMIT